MNKKLLSIGLIGATLFGCTGNKVSSSTSSSLYPISTSSSSSTKILNYELTNEMLSELSEGYEVEGIYTSKLGETIDYMNYYTYKCNDLVYDFKSYKEVASNPSKEVVSSSYRYEGFAVNDSVTILSLAKVTLNNKVVNYPVTDGYGNLLDWTKTGFANVFGEIKASYFEKTENDFEFELRSGELALRDIYSSLTSQFSSYMGLSMKSFKIRTDGEKIVSYYMDYQPLTTNAGKEMNISVEGEFINRGKDAVNVLKPYEGETDSDFDEIFELLQEQNYCLDVDLGVKSYKMSLENGTKLIYDEFDKNGIKTSSYGYYQKTSSLMQGVTKINGTIYEEGNAFQYSLANIYPTLQISSVLFTLNEEESTLEKSVYNFREDVSDDVPVYYDYGMFATSVVGELTIIIEEEKVTIINQLSKSQEKFTYYDIGKVSGSFTGMKSSCDELVWSELLSNQVEEFTNLQTLIPSEALDLIPTIGGKSSVVTANASYKPKVPALIVPITDAYATVYNNYSTQLVDAGFIKDTTVSTETQDVYTKEVEINGASKTLNVKINVPTSTNITQFIIFPSISD